eukprot:TRINITY_DN61268_c0_g1_i1.p1 TRINITY_DN61268_c0_g1~~TRINITY_DN61268_c0_g1_i1.p1  ORF type:complete len:877 (+),score=205.35 TRINITY_DN61268_c0_g1_i1:136-2631(+)
MAPKIPKMFTPSADMLAAAARPAGGGDRVSRARFRLPPKDEVLNPSAPSQPSASSQAVPVTPSGQQAKQGDVSPQISPPKTANPVLRNSSSCPPDAMEPPAKVQKTEVPVAAASAPTPARSKEEALQQQQRTGLPWEGIIVCFASDLDSLSQKDVEDRIKAAGGKVGIAVAQVTSYLVLGGKLEDGRPATDSTKYKRYAELKAKGKVKAEVLTEAEFLQRLPPLPQKAPLVRAAPAAALAAASASSSSAAPRTSEAPRPAGPTQELPKQSNWVDSHAPRSLGELVGNTGAIRKLADWLRDWEDVVLRGKTKKVPFRPGGGIPENLNARAALVSGPPGIGKTTTCRLVAQMQGGYEVLEYNASDARSQKVIQEMADGIADNTTISFGGTTQKATRRAVIIMDEVDGMGAGDRGGNAALIKMIKKTRNPIICICNDQHGQKVRSLAASCYDLKFSRPARNNVAQRCAEIARREGLQVDPSSLEALAESCGGDFRMVLNQLQMLGRTPGPASSISVKERLKQCSKDQSVMMGPFEACKKLLNASEAVQHSFGERLEMFFVDYSLVGLLVHENYLRSVEKKQVNSELLNRCAYSADLMTVGDIMSERIGAGQEWSLLPHSAVVASAYPAFVSNGVLGYPGFPAALGKMSSMSRSRRLAMELQAHLRLSGTVDKKALIVSPYADLLYRRLVSPLQRGDASAVGDTVDLMDTYGLRKEHLVEHLTELRQHLGGEDLFKQVDSKVKAAMTREFNSGAHAVKVLLPSKRRRATDSQEGLGNGEGEEGEEINREPEAGDVEGSDDEGVAALIKVKGAKSSSAKAKAKAKSKSAKAAKAKA